MIAMNDLKVYTIGYTQKSAKEFFALLRGAGAKHLLDIRLSNTSQLAGFTKRDDLSYLLRELLGMEYHEVREFAPLQQMLKEYRMTKDWSSYERSYARLMADRKPERRIDSKLLYEGIVLLCSEPKADHCHRRLAAEHLVKSKSISANIVHL